MLVNVQECRVFFNFSEGAGADTGFSEGGGGVIGGDRPCRRKITI